MKYTMTDIKRTAQAAIRSYTGTEPKLSTITLLEASDDRTYILFRVCDIEYRFSSYICDRRTDSIWVGDGTIERLGRRTKYGLV